MGKIVEETFGIEYSFWGSSGWGVPTWRTCWSHLQRTTDCKLQRRVSLDYGVNLPLACYYCSRTLLIVHLRLTEHQHGVLYGIWKQTLPEKQHCFHIPWSTPCWHSVNHEWIIRSPVEEGGVSVGETMVVTSPEVPLWTKFHPEAVTDGADEEGGERALTSISFGHSSQVSRGRRI